MWLNYTGNTKSSTSLSLQVVISSQLHKSRKVSEWLVDDSRQSIAIQQPEWKNIQYHYDVQEISVDTCNHIHTHIHTHIHPSTHTVTLTVTNTHTHTHTHTHTT